MFEIIIQNPQNITVGYYEFSHSHGFNSDGTYIIRADTQEHLEQILNDVANNVVPQFPPPLPSELEIVLADTLARQLDAETRVQELEMVLSQLIIQLMDNNALNA